MEKIYLINFNKIGDLFFSKVKALCMNYYFSLVYSVMVNTNYHQFQLRGIFKNFGCLMSSFRSHKIADACFFRFMLRRK